MGRPQSFHDVAENAGTGVVGICDHSKWVEPRIVCDTTGTPSAAKVVNESSFSSVAGGSVNGSPAIPYSPLGPTVSLRPWPRGSHVITM